MMADVVTESGSFDVHIYTLPGTSIFDPLSALVLNRAISSVYTRIINGRSLFRGIELTGKEVQNQQLAKLLRWSEVSGRNYEASAMGTRDLPGN